MKQFLTLILLTLAPFLALGNTIPKNKISALDIQFIDGLPFIEIQIQDKKIPVLFDLGASHTWLQLDSQILTGIKYLPEHKTMQIYNACGNEITEKMFQLKKLRIGDHALHNVIGSTSTKPFWCTDDATLKVNNGLIGLDLMKNFNLIIDYPKRKIYLFNEIIPSPYKLTNWTWLKFTMPNDNGIITQASIKDKKLNLLWDTGSNLSLLHIKETASLNAPVCIKETLQSSKCKNFKINDLSISGQKIGTINFSLMKNLKSPFDGTLGGTFFQNHIVYIDFNKRQIGILHYQP